MAVDHVYVYSSSGWVSEQRSLWEQPWKQPCSVGSEYSHQQGQATRRDRRWGVSRKRHPGRCNCAFLGLTVCAVAPRRAEQHPLKQRKHHENHNWNSEERGIPHNPTSRSSSVFLSSLPASFCPDVSRIFRVIIKCMCNLLYCLACLTLYQEHFVLLHSPIIILFSDCMTVHPIDTT